MKNTISNKIAVTDEISVSEVMVAGNLTTREKLINMLGNGKFANLSISIKSQQDKSADQGRENA